MATTPRSWSTYRWVGPSAVRPEYRDPTQIVYYKLEDILAGSFKRHLIDSTLTMIHGVELVRWDNDNLFDVLTASFDGVNVLQSHPAGFKKIHIGSGVLQERPAQGSSEVSRGQLDKKVFISTIEPWHGNNVVVYSGPEWHREVIDSTLNDGHALAVCDFKFGRI